MNRDEAKALRTRQLNGAYVEPNLLQEAISVIARTNEPLRRVPRGLTLKGTKPRKAKQQTESDGVDIDAVHEAR